MRRDNSPKLRAGLSKAHAATAFIRGFKLTAMNLASVRSAGLLGGVALRGWPLAKSLWNLANG